MHFNHYFLVNYPFVSFLSSHKILTIYESPKGSNIEYLLKSTNEKLKIPKIKFFRQFSPTVQS